MPATSTYTPPPAPTVGGDLLVKVEIKRDGEYPTIACIFQHVGETDGFNCLGLPTYPPLDERVFTLFLDSRNAPARQRIGTLLSGAASRVVAGEDFDSAMANEAYDLLTEADALDSTAAILAQMGVTIPSAYNPFPA